MMDGHHLDLVVVNINIYNMKNKINNRLNRVIDEDACMEFLMKYGKNQLLDSIKIFSVGDDDIDTKYKNWLNWKKTNDIGFGGERSHILIEKYDIDEVIYNYNWGKLGGWFELFIYVHDIVNGQDY